MTYDTVSQPIPSVCAGAQLKALLVGFSAHSCKWHVSIACAKVSVLKPRVVAKPFADKNAKHWFDEFTGDINEAHDLSEFLLETIFTTAPHKLHETLNYATDSL